MDNILLDEAKNVKIIDFGFSIQSRTNSLLKLFCGTPSYMCPEIVSRKPYLGPPSDMWSAGVILFYMLTGTAPFRSNSSKDLYKLILRCSYRMPSSMSNSSQQLIGKLLVYDATARITAAEAHSNYNVKQNK